MKKSLNIVSVVLIIILSIFVVGCTSKDYSNYKNEVGYKEYTKLGKGSCYVDSFGVQLKLGNKNVQSYLENNMRQSGNYLITNFMDGICINRYVGDITTVDIPDTIDGKPVIMIGAFINDEKETKGAFAGIEQCKLKISKTVKYIDSRVLCDYSNCFEAVEVDKSNPYYCSENNILYSKDKETLLYIKSGNEFEDDKFFVPNTVENFCPIDALDDYSYQIIFNKNIKNINACVDLGEDGVTPKDTQEKSDYFIPSAQVVIKCYKGTVAEKWAKEHGLLCIYLDNK